LAIIQAIQNRNQARAEELMRLHLRKSLEVLKKEMERKEEVHNRMTSLPTRRES